jgi:Tfp pilus assembly protein PilF
MSHTLNLVAGLLAAVRNLQQSDQCQSALDLLQRLAGFRNLPRDVAEEVHSRLADLHAGREEFARARRHLTIALTYRPQHADYHHRMARYIETDPEAALGRAGRYYLQAVRSDPDNAAYWADYGTYLMAGGRRHAGRRALMRAFDLAGSAVGLVVRIAAALRDDELWNDARRLLRRALFQNARDPRFRALWQQHQFEWLARQQRRGNAISPARRPAVLPFPRKTPRPTVHVDGKIIRFDRAPRPINSRTGQR